MGIKQTRTDLFFLMLTVDKDKIKKRKDFEPKYINKKKF